MPFFGGLLRRALLILLLLMPLAAAAAEPLEIIELRHRPAEQVLPVLRPLLAPGASLSGFGNKLFIRAPAANLIELRAALAALDVPAARLLISVRQSAASSADASRADVYGRIGSGTLRIERPSADGRRSGPGVVVELDDRQRTARSTAIQQVQTVEGGQAFIHAGVSLPVPLRRLWLRPDGAVISDTVIWRDLGTGFNAVPRIVGERVSVEISPYEERPAAPDGTAEIRRLSTTIEGPLGEWIALGAGAHEAAGTRQGVLTHDAQGVSRHNEVWLKIERVD